jgi:positive regulator of sigma E activity
MDYNIINIVCEFCTLLILRRFFGDFFERDEHKNRLRNVYSALWLIVTLLVAKIVDGLGNKPGMHVLKLAVGILLALLIVATYKGKLWKKLLVTPLIFVLFAACDEFAYELTLPIIGQDKYYYSFIFTVIFEALLEYALGAWLKKGRAWQLARREMLLVSLFPILSVVILYCVTVMSTGVYQFVACLATVGITILSVVLYNNLSINLEKRWEQESLERQVKSYRHEIETMQISDRKMQNLRHDLRHHLIELDGLARKGEAEELCDYIAKMRENFTDVKRPVQTGEYEIDSLVNFLIDDANSRGIEVVSECLIPEDIRLSQYKLNVIVGNLLENAIEAASKAEEKKVYFDMQYSQGILYLRIKNTFAGTVSIKDGKIVSKSEEENHGIGLRSVCDMIEEQNGKIETRVEEKYVVVEVILPEVG